MYMIGRCSVRTLFAALAVFSTFPTWADGFLSKSYRPERDLLMDISNAEQRLKDARIKASEYPEFIPDYVQAGITISDISCDAWLAVLGRSDRNTNLFKDVLNIVGNLIIGVSGINGASSTSLARGALGLSAANASVDAFRNEILLGSMMEIEKKMKEGRRISAAFFVENIPTQFDDAVRKMGEYHDICSTTEIQNLLKTSLAHVKYVAPDTSLTDSIDSASADLLSAALYSMIYKPGDPGAVGSLSRDSVYGLWVSVIGAPNDTSSNLVKNIKDSANVISLKKQFEDKNKNGELAPTLQRIADLRGYSKRLAKDLAKEKADKAKADAQAVVENEEESLIHARDEGQKAIRELATNIVMLENSNKETSAVERIYQNFNALQFLWHSGRISFSEPQVKSLENMTHEMKILEQSNPSPAATDARLKLKAFVEKAKALEAARTRLRNLPAHSATQSNTPSISAVIVPVR